MRNIKKYIALLLAASSMPAAAQYDQDIDVEGKYTPEYIAMDRIGMFPKPIKFAVEKSSLAYSLGGVNSNFTPNAIPAVATGWNDTRLHDDSRGYLDFGIGSYLNSLLSAGYRIFDEEGTTLGVRLQHNSTSLWKPDLKGAGGENLNAESKMWRYDESLGVYGNHTFGDSGSLDAAIDYHLGCFNYYACYPYNNEAYDKAPTQTLNDISARLCWSSPAEIDNLYWYVGAGVRYFGFRSVYFQEPEAIGLSSSKGLRETNVSLNTGIAFPTSSKSTIGIDLDGNFIGYGGGVFNPFSDGKARSYGALFLTPYYRFTRAGVNVRVGAEIDLSFNAREAEGRYRTFNIAPSVKLDYRSGGFAIFLNLLGGNRLRTLANLYEHDYYMAPVLSATVPEYSPLDASLGVSFGPFNGFHAGLEFDYKITKNQSLSGWYSSMRYPSSVDCVYNMSGYSAAIDFGYDAGKYFKIDAKATFQPQSVKHGYFNGIDRAKWTMSARVETNPWSSLKFSVGCDWRAGRGFLVMMDSANSVESESEKDYIYSISNWFSLNLGASYDVTKNIGVWLQADNLINRKNLYAPFMPTPGIIISAGASFKF